MNPGRFSLEGWELAAVHPREQEFSGHATYIFKRPKAAEG